MAKVNFIRRHTDVEVDEEPIVDGNFIVTGDGNIYIDYGLERIKIVGGGGGNATGDTLPIGSITAYGKETAPVNWLICDGSAVSRTSYANLFAVIGTKYGEGDGSTTFNLPNLKGRVPVGLDSDDTDFNTIGKTGGEKNVVLTIDTMPSHGHIIPYSPNANGDVVATAQYIPQSGHLTNETNGRGWSNAGTAQTGGNQPHNNLQPYEVNNFIIKAFQSAGVVAEVVNTQTESDTSVYSCDYINNTIAYCRMSINGTEIIPTEGKIITSFVNPISYGGFVADKDNGYLFIPKGTKTIETCGMICGKGYFSARLEIKDADGAYLSTYNYTSGSILTQPSGNGYTATALPTSIIELDETKDWYIYIRISGYAQNFIVNDGFGTQTAWFGAKKVR